MTLFFNHPLWNKLQRQLNWPWAISLLLWMILLAILGFTKVQLEVLVNDKWLHFTAFFVFSLLLFESTRFSLPWKLIGTAAVGITVSILSEFIQGLLSYRTFDVHDIYANLVGTLIANLICFLRSYWNVIRSHLKSLFKRNQMNDVPLLPRHQNDLNL